MMKTLILIAMWGPLTLSGFAQSLQENGLFETNGITFPPLYDPEFTASFGNPDRRYASPSINDSLPEKAVYYPSCRNEPLALLDSIDITGDGVKELFVHRICHCNVTRSDHGPYGEGNQGQVYGVYEVWDVRTHARIFALQHIRESMVAVSTNVIHSFGYRFEVTLGENGAFQVSGDTSGSPYSPGTYVYNREKGGYFKE